MSASDVTIEPVADANAPSRQLTLGWHWFWLALVLAALPMLVHYFLTMWKLDHYRFFPFVLLAVGGLAYSRFDGVFRAPRGWLAWSAIAVGLLAILGAVILRSPWLTAVGFVLIVTAMLGSHAGEEDASLLGLAVPLLLLVRLPLGYDQLLIISLQRMTTQLSSVLLDVVAIPHAVAGNVIQLASRELFVAEACSGIQSVFTLAFLSLLLIAVLRRPLWLAPLYLLVACVLAVAANVLRVSMVAAGEVWFEADWASGWTHELVGYVALAIGAGLLLSFDQLLAAVMHPVPDMDELGRFNPLVAAWNVFATAPSYSQSSQPAAGGSEHAAEEHIATTSRWAASWGTMALAGVLLIGSVVAAFSLNGPGIAPMFAATDAVYSPQTDLFDGEFKSMKVISHESVRDGTNPRLGENADIWNCEIGGVPAQLVLSQTYRGWHELCVCYENSEWQLVDRRVEPTTEVSGPDQPPVAAAVFSRDTGQTGRLIYTGITTEGQAVNPPELHGRLTTRFFATLYDGTELAPDQEMLMLQLWVTSDEKLDPEVYRQLKKDFARARDVVAAELKGAPGA